MPRLAILALALPLLAHAADPDPAGDVQAAARKSADQSSYAFTLTEGPGKPLTGAWQKGQPLAVTADGIPFLRKGAVLVYLDIGKWQRTRTGTLSDPLRILG